MWSTLCSRSWTSSSRLQPSACSSRNRPRGPHERSARACPRKQEPGRARVIVSLRVCYAVHMYNCFVPQGLRACLDGLMHARTRPGPMSVHVVCGMCRVPCPQHVPSVPLVPCACGALFINNSLRLLYCVCGVRARSYCHSCSSRTQRFQRFKM